MKRLPWLAVLLVALSFSTAVAVLPPQPMSEAIAQHADVYDVRVLEILSQTEKSGDTVIVWQEFSARIDRPLKGTRAAGDTLRFVTHRIKDSPAIRALQKRPIPGPAPDRGPGLVQTGQVVRVFLKSASASEPLPVSRIAAPSDTAIPR